MIVATGWWHNGELYTQRPRERARLSTSFDLSMLALATHGFAAGFVAPLTVVPQMRASSVAMQHGGKGAQRTLHL